MTRKCWIFDIDGTLSDPTHRLHLIKQEKPDWRAFFAAVGGDLPHPHMCALARALISLDDDTNVILVSGRSDECYSNTVYWLVDNIGNEWHTLYMRKAGDHRPDHIVKMEILARLQADGWEPIMAFDDRDRVVKAWREVGIPCAQVAGGDF